jgi:hypothetical protein
MLRVLVINNSTTGDQQDGEQWVYRQARTDGRLLFSDQRRFVDHDLFIVSSGSLSEARGPDIKHEVRTEIVERVSAGACLVCFLDSEQVGWLPEPLRARQTSGELVDLVTHEVGSSSNSPQPPIYRLLRGFERELAYEVQIEDLGNNWKPLAQAKNERAVAAYTSRGKGAIVLLPNAKARAKIIRRLIDQVLPQLCEQPPKSLGPREDAPTWLQGVTVPGGAELENEAAKLERDIYDLRQALEAKRGEAEARLGHRDLLWQTDTPLEEGVRKALALLGIEASKRPPIDLVHAIGNGRELYIEIEGTTSAVSIKKGRQLLQYIADAPDPSLVEGAIVGNPHRLVEPAVRNDPFTADLRKLAKKHNWQLVTTDELFRLVCRNLGGDTKASDEARTILGL